MNEGNVLATRLEIDDIGYDHLVETAKWAKFLAIVGIILSSLLALIAVFAGTLMGMFIPSEVGQSISTVSISIVYILIAAVYLFTSIYLFRFAVKMQNSLGLNDQDQFNAALSNQRIFYRIIGIIMIIYLVIIALAIVIMVFAVGSMT